MATIRLDSEGRRKAIVDAALPRFAQKGFAGTTTKEIAEAAGISEALLFKHFPTKGALYQEILRVGCKADPALVRLQTLEPSTRTLIHMMHFMVYHFVVGAFGNTEELTTRKRLMLSSFLDDGEFARQMFEFVADEVCPKFEASVAAAERAGDVVPLGVTPVNRFWFAQHVAAMMAYIRLPGRAVAPYAGDLDTVIAEAVRFILRGIGLRSEVIATQYDPHALSLFLQPAAD